MTSGTRIGYYAYDAWGKLRNTNGADDTSDSLTVSVNRSFNSQEPLTDVAWINLNARMYDPQTARFLSTDPLVASPFSTQGWNRYAYAGNNPLTFTDPSGMCFLGCFWKSPVFVDVLAVVVAAAGQEWALPALEGAVGADAASLAGLNAAISGAAAGAIQSGSLSGALTGGIEAGLFYEVGSLTDGHFGGPNGVNAYGSTVATYAENQPLEFTENVFGHAVIGGLGNIANGSSFQSGFLAAGFSDAAGPTLASAHIDSLETEAIVGGFGSVLGGGKFENGAVTGAFGYLFNECAAGGGGTCSFGGAINAAGHGVFSFFQGLWNYGVWTVRITGLDGPEENDQALKEMNALAWGVNAYAEHSDVRQVTNAGIEDLLKSDIVDNDFTKWFIVGRWGFSAFAAPLSPFAMWGNTAGALQSGHQVYNSVYSGVTGVPH